jgi:rare lipoprotein A
VTKRRPWWSDFLIRAAAIICSLLLVGPALAAPPGKKATESASTAFGMADVLGADAPGLQGSASFYGSGFQGRRTASGDRFDARAFTAASNRFPLNSWVAVQRPDNDRCAIVKINDRMHARHRKRIIDVSRGVAEYLGMVRAGVVLVRVAPIKGARTEANCHAAFEPDEAEVRHGQPPKLPEIEGAPER